MIGGHGNGTKQNGSRCPACGKATTINIVMPDQITPAFENGERGRRLGPATRSIVRLRFPVGT